MKKKLYLTVAMTSAALISYQVILMHVLSIAQWHHFAYMIISAAMLGFGASGTLLALFKDRKVLDEPFTVFSLLVAASAAILVSTVAISSPFLSFDSYRALSETEHMLRVVFSYGLFFIPVLAGALVIALLFVKHPSHTSRLYFANLLGSAAGASAPLAMISNCAPERLIPLVSLTPLACAAVMFPKKRKKYAALILFFAAASVFFLILRPPSLHISQYKGISYALNQPGSEIIDCRRTIYGLLEYVKTPTSRFAPGLSLSYGGDIPRADTIFLNSEEFGPVFKDKKDYDIFDHTPKALVFKLASPQSVLVLEEGTFYSAFFAQRQNVENIIVCDPLADEIASLIAKHTDGGIPDFTFRSVEPKTYLLIAGSKFGLITLPPANTFRGTAGLYALREQYTLTVESIRKMIQLLNDGGFIYIPVWTDQPPRAPLKLLATISQSLELESLLPQRHLAAVRDWNMIHFMVSKSPFSESQLALMEKFSREKKFDIILPEKLGSGPDKFHKFGKDDFVFSVSRILSGKRENFIAGYKFNISPPTDDRPFFLNFLTFRAARHIIRTGSFRDFSFIELGYMIMIAAFFQVSFAAVILIILPLFKIKKKLKNKFFSITYFSCLGLGFIFLEMVFIQKFTLYFGSPVSAAGFVMAFMLGTSGLGSYTSSKFNATAGNILKVCFCVFLAVLAVSLILDSVIYRTIGAFPGIKALIAFAVIFPAAFLMGMPFPLGLKFIGKKDVSNIPWCWGIDGSLSVIGAVLASIISVNLGFSAVMFSVIVLYLAAALSTVSAGQ